MAKRHLLILGLFLSGSALASACSDTKAVGIDSDAGAGGEAGEQSHGGSGNAGSGHAGSANAGSANAGSANAGTGNEAGEGGATSEGGMGGEGGQGEPPYEFPASLNPQDVIVVGAAPSTNSKLLVQASDFKNHKGEVVSLTIASGAVGDSETYEDSDLVATSSAGIGFAIERTNDKVHQLDGGKIAKTFDLKGLGTNKPITGTKAYVPFYNQSLIAVLDLTEGTVSHRIDLNQYNAPGDSDHSADITEGVYDPNSKLAYFLLQRIDINAISADPNFQLHCANYNALIVAVDTRIDDVVDLNGEAPGKGIELKLANPNSLSINTNGDTLYVLGNGCFEGENKTKHGIEVIDLTDHSTKVEYQAAGNDYLARLIRTVGTNALIQSLDASYATHWHKIDISQHALGNEIANVPQAPSFDGTDLLGVQVTAKVGKVVRYTIATETSTEISPTSWGGEYSSASSTALVQ
jgi:hypothetical protein